MSGILVTGASGYLGGRLASHLRGRGLEVACGTRSPGKGSQPGWRITDFEDLPGLSKAFAGHDAIIHLAGMNEVEAAKNPEAALHTTATYTLRAVQAAVAAGVPRFIYFSTVHVYGAPLSGYLTEVSPTRPAHPYSITHRAAEDFAYLAHREGRISATIFRLSNSYGYSERPDVDRWSLLVNDLCRQAAMEGSLTLKTSGLQYRDFIPIRDVCGVVERFLDLPRYEDPVFNLGSGQSVTVLEMAHRIAERFEVLTGNRLVLRIPPAKLGEASLAFRFSVEKLSAIGISPSSLADDEIDESLRRCLAWHAKGLL